MMQLLQFLLDALSLGGMYAFFRLGVALIFSVFGIINFAYGNFIAAGAYASVLLGGLVWPLADEGAGLIEHLQPKRVAPDLPVPIG